MRKAMHCGSVWCDNSMCDFTTYSSYFRHADVTHENVLRYCTKGNSYILQLLNLNLRLIRNYIYRIVETEYRSHISIRNEHGQQSKPSEECPVRACLHAYVVYIVTCTLLGSFVRASGDSSASNYRNHVCVLHYIIANAYRTGRGRWRTRS